MYASFLVSFPPVWKRFMMYLLPLSAYSAGSVSYGFLYNYYITCTRSYTVLQSENRLCPIPLFSPSLRSKQFKPLDIQFPTSIYSYDKLRGRWRYRRITSDPTPTIIVRPRAVTADDRLVGQLTAARARVTNLYHSVTLCARSRVKVGILERLAPGRVECVVGCILCK